MKAFVRERADGFVQIIERWLRKADHPMKGRHLALRCRSRRPLPCGRMSCSFIRHYKA